MKRILVVGLAVVVVLMSWSSLTAKADGPYNESLGQLPSGWFITHNSLGGYDAEGNCLPGACVSFPGGQYARLELTSVAGTGPTQYQGAEIAELWTGFMPDTETTHVPAPGETVSFCAEARFSPGIIQRGSGSLGVWLWNSLDFTQEGFGDLHAIGFTMMPRGEHNGIVGTVFDVRSGQVYYSPAVDIDVTGWADYCTYWSADAVGNQSVVFAVNGVTIGSSPIVMPMGSLSVELWNDNQEGVGFSVILTPIRHEQWMDVRNLRLSK